MSTEQIRDAIDGLNKIKKTLRDHQWEKWMPWAHRELDAAIAALSQLSAPAPTAEKALGEALSDLVDFIDQGKHWDAWARGYLSSITAQARSLLAHEAPQDESAASEAKSCAKCRYGQHDPFFCDHIPRSCVDPTALEFFEPIKPAQVAPSDAINLADEPELVQELQRIVWLIDEGLADPKLTEAITRIHKVKAALSSKGT